MEVGQRDRMCHNNSQVDDNVVHLSFEFVRAKVFGWDQCEVWQWIVEVTRVAC